jgi:hypothetical protein
MGETQRSFLPNAGFAVKTTTVHSPRAAKPSAAALLSIAPPAPALLTLPKGSTVYINITSHAAVEAPMDQMGNSLADSRPLVSANGLQMSLVVSPPRAPPSTTSTAAKKSKKLVVEADSVLGVSKAADTTAAAQSLTFDAVVHPWALQCCQSSRGFQAQVVELVLGWVEAEGESPKPQLQDDELDDCDIENNGSNKQQQQRARLSRSWQLITHAAYVHGTGSNGDAPVPFLVDDAERQSCPPEQRTSTSNSSSTSSGSGIKTAGAAGSVPELVQRSMAEPHSLLAAMAQQSNSGTSTSTGSANSGSSGGLAGRAPLDIRLPGSRQQHNTNNSTTATTNATTSSTAAKQAVLIEEVGAVKPASTKQKPVKPAVKKGFLNSAAAKKKSAVLYPEGSTEGQGAGSYAKLMSRCKVI